MENTRDSDLLNSGLIFAPSYHHQVNPCCLGEFVEYIIIHLLVVFFYWSQL